MEYLHDEEKNQNNLVSSKQYCIFVDPNKGI